MRTRVIQPELMDDPGIDPEVHQRALAGLARLNTLSMIQRTVFREIQRIGGGSPLTILDVAAGSGDLSVGLAERAAKLGCAHQFTCSDISVTACGAVEQRAEDASLSIDTVVRDIIQDGIDGEYDIVMCHLFLHHLKNDDVVRVLRSMHAAAKLAVLITDLERARIGYALAYAASRVFTRSHVVHTDALLSVRAALRPEELRSLASDAGIENPTIKGIWPARMMLISDTRS